MVFLTVTEREGGEGGRDEDKTSTFRLQEPQEGNHPALRLCPLQGSGLDQPKTDSVSHMSM